MELWSWTSSEWPNRITLPKNCIANWKPPTHPWDGNGQKDNYGSKGTSMYLTKISSAYRLSTTTMTTWPQATLGETRTSKLIHHNFHLLSLCQMVKAYMASCATCAHAKSARHKPYGKLKQLPIPS